MLGSALSLGDIVFKNLIPAVLGNAVAGALIVAASYSYQFGRLGGLRRAIFQDKLDNIKKDLAARRSVVEKEMASQVKEALS